MNTATLGLHLFATERLRTLGEAVTDLSASTSDGAARLNAIKRYAQARQSISEDDLYARCSNRLSTHRAAVPHTGVQRRRHLRGLRSRPGSYLGEPVESLRLALRHRRASASPTSDRRRRWPAHPPMARTVDELLTRCQALCDDAVGISGVIQPEPQSPPACASRRSPTATRRTGAPSRLVPARGALGQLEPERGVVERAGAGVPAMARRSRRPVGNGVLGAAGLRQAIGWPSPATRCRRRGGFCLRGGVMLPLQDAQVRLVPSITSPVRLADAAGRLDARQASRWSSSLAHLLSAVDLSRLAAMRTPDHRRAFDGAALRLGCVRWASSTRPRRWRRTSSATVRPRT